MFKRVLFSTALLTTLTGAAAFAQTGVGVWTVRDLGSSGESRGVRDMDMPSASVIWGVQYDGTQGGGPVQDLFVSTDGGMNWLTNSIVTANAGGKDLANVSAVDGNTAYISAYDPTATGPTGVLFKTTDGGNTFTEVAIPSVSFLNVVHFFDANTGLLMSDPSAGDYEIFRTTDAGATWARVPGAALPNAVANDYGLVNQFSAVGDHFWFSTLKGRVYHSPDRGVTWTVSDTGLREPAANQAALRNLTFADAMNGLAVSGAATPVVKRTTDGGATWTTIAPTGPFYSNNITRVPGQPTPTYVGTNVSATSGPGVGSSFSTDGGLTWTELDNGNAQYTDVIFFDATHGWAGGFTGTNGTAGIFEFTGTLTGTAPTASVSVSQSSVAFAATAVGSTSTQTFTVTNSGTAPLNITSITTTGPFTVTPNTATTVAPGASVTMTVTFAPTTAGAQTGSVVIASNATNMPSATVALTGATPTGLTNDALSAAVQLYPSPVNAGTAAVLRLTGALTLAGTPATVTDALGRAVLTLPAPAGATELTVATGALRAGLYTVQVRTSRGVVARTLVVQ